MMGRATVPALDALLDKPIPVLDQGFVIPIDYVGSDARVIEAARLTSNTAGRKPHEDRTLLRYLMRHQHTTPFEMCDITFHARVPMDTWRQWIRHRTASVNEHSTRYSEAIDAMQQTPPDDWRRQASNNRQGSSDERLPHDIGAMLSREEDADQFLAQATYRKRLTLGVAREQARKDLLLSTYTEAYWKIDLHNLLHFLRLRLDPHAQQEIRSYAEAIASIVAQWVPITWQAFVDYRMDVVTLSADEVRYIREIRADSMDDATDTWKGLSRREQSELREKLATLGMPYEEQ